VDPPFGQTDWQAPFAPGRKPREQQANPGCGVVPDGHWFGQFGPVQDGGVGQFGPVHDGGGVQFGPVHGGVGQFGPVHEVDGGQFGPWQEGGCGQFGRDWAGVPGKEYCSLPDAQICWHCPLEPIWFAGPEHCGGG
jgi:hypothetical protein